MLSNSNEYIHHDSLGFLLVSKVGLIFKMWGISRISSWVLDVSMLVVTVQNNVGFIHQNVHVWVIKGK